MLGIQQIIPLCIIKFVQLLQWNVFLLYYRSNYQSVVLETIFTSSMESNLSFSAWISANLLNFPIISQWSGIMHAYF
jgi:hypothetical protein